MREARNRAKLDHRGACETCKAATHRARPRRTLTIQMMYRVHATAITLIDDYIAKTPERSALKSAQLLLGG